METLLNSLSISYRYHRTPIRSGIDTMVLGYNIILIEIDTLLILPICIVL